MSNAPDLTAAAVKMVFSLAVILALLWGFHRWVRRTRPGGTGGGRGRLIQVMGSHYLGMKKSIAVVKVPGTILVLGIGAEQVSLLTRIDDPDLIADCEKAQDTATGMSFREQLQRMTRPLIDKSGCVGSKDQDRQGEAGGK